MRTMLWAAWPFLLAMTGFFIVVLLFFSSVGRLLDASQEGLRLKLFLRGEKSLRWNELKPGRFGYVLGIPVLSVDRRHESFLSNPADFILILNLPKDKALLNVISERLGIEIVRLPLGP